MEYTEYAPKEGDDKVRRKLMFITKMAPASANLVFLDFKPEEDEPMVDEKEEDLDLSGFTIS